MAQRDPQCLCPAFINLQTNWIAVFSREPQELMEFCDRTPTERFLCGHQGVCRRRGLYILLEGCKITLSGPLSFVDRMRFPTDIGFYHVVCSLWSFSSPWTLGLLKSTSIRRSPSCSQKSCVYCMATCCDIWEHGVDVEMCSQYRCPGHLALESVWWSLLAKSHVML